MIRFKSDSIGLKPLFSVALLTAVTTTTVLASTALVGSDRELLIIRENKLPTVEQPPKPENLVMNDSLDELDTELASLKKGLIKDFPEKGAVINQFLIKEDLLAWQEKEKKAKKEAEQAAAEAKKAKEQAEKQKQAEKVQAEQGVVATTEEQPPQAQATQAQPVSSGSPQLYTLDQFLFSGIIHYSGYKYSYYSQSVLPGGGLAIPGRHVNANGFVADADGFIVLANSAPKGTVFPTPFGAPGKVYDRGTVGNHLDVYVR